MVTRTNEVKDINTVFIYIQNLIKKLSLATVGKDIETVSASSGGEFVTDVFLKTEPQELTSEQENITRGNIGRFWGVCTTAATEKAKIVPLNGTLYAGATVNVKFTNGHTVEADKGTKTNNVWSQNTITGNYPTLNGYPIKVGGEYAGEGFVNAGEVHEFFFDGEAFHDKDAVNIYAGEYTANNVHSVFQKRKDKLIRISVNDPTTTTNTSYEGGRFYFVIPFSNVDYSIQVIGQMTAPYRDFTVYTLESVGRTKFSFVRQMRYQGIGQLRYGWENTPFFCIEGY